MEDIVWKFNLGVKKVRGKDEFEIYRNYLSDLPFASLQVCLQILFETTNLKQKNDSRALSLRVQGNTQFKFKNYEKSLWLYTKSLRYANYNGKEYAVALANRSAVHFDLEDYKSSIDDINLCLQANYPKHLKPKVHIRKAKCYQKLGESSDMRKTLLDLLNYLDDNTEIKSAKIVKYKKMVKELITASADSKPDTEDNFDILPTMNSNPKFLNASASITLKYNKRKGCYVVAKKDIERGDVLFVEEAYTFAPAYFDDSFKEYAPIYCQYCLSRIVSCVPCKNCVKHLYCNENCRDAAWKEFHQWECIAVQARFFRISPEGYLALRICLKAVLTGISTNTINFEKGINSYGNKDNNYPYVYNLPSYTNKMKKDKLMEYSALAALLVHYLRMKTKFFEWMQQLPAYSNKSYKDLMNKIGGLILRHCTQFHRSILPIKAFDNQRIPDIDTIALMVCPSIAMMSHSCIPNTTLYFVGNTVVVKAIDNIKINEEVYSAWGNFSFISRDKKVRQALLQKLYYLNNCSCQICSDPRMDTRDLYLCINCNGPASITDNTIFFQQLTCLDCNSSFILPIQIAVGRKLAYSHLVRFVKIPVCDLENLEDANKCLQISQSIFKPTHSIFNELYQKLLKYYKLRGEAECFIKIANMLVQYTERKYYSNFAVYVGLLYYFICLDCIDILKVTAPKINIKQLGEMLEELTKFIEKAKVVFTLQCPQFGTRLQKLEKSFFELRILHTLQIANSEENDL